MIGSTYKDALGKEFKVTLVDHTMDGSWVHYQATDSDKQYNCLIDAFKERFTKVEKTR